MQCFYSKKIVKLDNSQSLNTICNWVCKPIIFLFHIFRISSISGTPHTCMNSSIDLGFSFIAYFISCLKLFSYYLPVVSNAVILPGLYLDILYRIMQWLSFLHLYPFTNHVEIVR